MNLFSLGNLNFKQTSILIYLGFNFHIIRFANTMASAIYSCIISSTIKMGIILKEVFYS